MHKYMLFRFSLICFSILAGITITFAQIKGNVKDKEGNPLPYASVYLIGSSTGTVSNASGDYELELKEKGQVTITCQYVGYKKETFTINYTGSPVIKNIILSEDENLLNELVIIADREDPSYPIIRKAIMGCINLFLLLRSKKEIIIKIY